MASVIIWIVVVILIAWVVALTIAAEFLPNSRLGHWFLNITWRAWLQVLGTLLVALIVCVSLWQVLHHIGWIRSAIDLVSVGLLSLFIIVLFHFILRLIVGGSALDRQVFQAISRRLQGRKR